VFGPEVLGGLGAPRPGGGGRATIVVASVVALRQDHLKRRLAYSTIAHLAYIVLGFALLSRSGFEGSLLHIVNHGALKITLFFAAGAIHVAPAPRPRQRARRHRPPCRSRWGRSRSRRSAWPACPRWAGS
jgi:hypothetical protein